MPEGSGGRCSLFWRKDSGNTEYIFEYNEMMMTSNGLGLVQEMGKISPRK